MYEIFEKKNSECRTSIGSAAIKATLQAEYSRNRHRVPATCVGNLRPGRPQTDTRSAVRHLLPRTLCQTSLRPRTSFCGDALRRPQRLVQEGLIDRTSSATPRRQGLIDRASSGRPARYRSAESGSTASARRSSSVSGIFAMRHRPTSQGSVTYIDSLLRFLS